MPSPRRRSFAPPPPGRRWLLALAGLSLFVAVAAPIAGSQGESFPFTRTLRVERPGPARLELDFETVSRLEPDAGDLHLFAPDGRQLPFRHQLQPRAEHRLPLLPLAVERRADGWRIELDTGSSGDPHRALWFEMTREALAPAVRLEASGDRSSWRLLTEGDLFRLGGGEGLRRAALGYPPTRDRYLRLDWPTAAGFPEADRITVERAPPRPVEQRLESPPCRRRAPGELVCRLATGSHHGERLSLELSGEGTIGYRLAAADGGSWKDLSEGTWRLAGGGPVVRVPQSPPLEQPTELLLELFSRAGPAPVVHACTFEYRPRTLFFRAPTAGEHTMAYGGERAASLRTLSLSAAERRHALPVEAAPPVRHPPPPLPAAVVAARQPLPSVAFSASWQVTASGAGPGSVVRLPLPAAVLAVSRRAPADLRLAVADRQLPFLSWRPPAPVAVPAGATLRPRPGAVKGRSHAELELPAAALISQIELTTPAGPFDRRVRTRAVGGAGAKLGAAAPFSRWMRWVCRPHPPLPCRLSLPPARNPGERLQLEFDDGDNPPLAELRVELWRRTGSLVFVWPASGEVRLLAGNPQLPPPSYDLELIRGELMRRSWTEAELDLAASAARRAGSDRRARLLMMIAIALAAGFLVLLLFRVLRAADGSADGER